MSAAEKPRAAHGPAQPEAEHFAIPLRTLEARTRALPLDAQMTECVDLLQTPELVVTDLVRSVLSIREAGESQSATRVALASNDGSDQTPFFYPSRDLFVQGDGCSFTCLATEVDFVEQGSPDSESASAVPEGQHAPEGHHAIDYAAVTCESRPFPMLGFTQQSETESAYPILLHALASLIELTRPRRFDLLDREVYRGLLGPAPCFDLTLVLWDDDRTTDPRRPLCELSRDLAEKLKAALAEETRFPPVLHDIVCLRMNNKRFDGRLRFVWRV